MNKDLKLKLISAGIAIILCIIVHFVLGIKEVPGYFEKPSWRPCPCEENVLP